MTYYRVGSMDIRWGTEIIYRDSIHNFPQKKEVITKLVKLGRIAPISGPPLSLLEGFEDIADKLEKKGIVKAEQFLEAGLEDIKPVFRSQKKLDEKKQELIDKHLLIIVDNRDCDSC